MGFKKQIWNRFFGPKPDKVRDKQVPQDLVPKTITEQAAAAAAPPVREVELKLPPEHALHTLCDMRIERAGGMARPNLRLEGREDFSQADLRKELARLQKTVTQAANSRLKEVRSWEKAAAAIAEKAAAAEEDMPIEEQEPPILEMDALPLIHIAADKLSAWMMVFPPVGEGRELNHQLLDEALENNGIAFGVDEELIANLPENRERYFYLYNVAKGIPAQHGKDGHIIENYDRVVERKFEVDERDRVDYASLTYFQNVEKGDVICEAVPPTEGEPGRTIHDEEIPAKDGKNVSISKGRNTELSEDGTKLLAAKDGHVEYVGRGFQVTAVLDIAENVDYSTGNIDYVGDVHVHGNICGGFHVKAEGNVIVDGIVEGGSIEATGDIVVAKGIVGTTPEIVRSGQKIFAKYLENSTVHAKELLKADCVFNSDVYCDGDIDVCNGRGIIVGGKIRAAKKVSAKFIGSKSESQTAVFLGGEPCVEYKRKNLERTIEEKETELEKLLKRPDSPSTIERIRQMHFDMEEDRNRLREMDEELERKLAEVESHGGCRMTCDIAYPGVVLTINRVMVRLQHETSKCNARLVDGNIKFL